MIKGKTIFSWNVPSILNGDPKLLAAILVDAGFEGVNLKAGDGNTIFKMSTSGPWPKWGENIKLEFVNALRDAGLKINFWDFLYGIDPKGELDIAIHQCKEFHPDGYIWDVEGAFDSKKTADENARLISKGLKDKFPEIPQALCWWALPKNPSNYAIEWHPIHVAKAFMEIVDYVMPMMYWGGQSAATAALYLQSSLDVWRSFCNLPIIPVGRAYTGDGGTIDATAIITFAQKVFGLASSKNLVGTSWWVLDRVFENPVCWSALKTTPKFFKPVPKPEPVKLTLEEKVERLVSNHPDLFPELPR